MTTTKYNGGFNFRHFHFSHYLGEDVSGNGIDKDSRINAIIRDPENEDNGIIQIIDENGNTTQVSVIGIYATGTVEASEGIRIEEINGVKTVVWGGKQNQNQTLYQSGKRRDRFNGWNFDF